MAAHTLSFVRSHVMKWMSPDGRDWLEKVWGSSETLNGRHSLSRFSVGLYLNRRDLSASFWGRIYLLNEVSGGQWNQSGVCRDLFIGSAHSGSKQSDQPHIQVGDIWKPLTYSRSSSLPLYIHPRNARTPPKCPVICKLLSVQVWCLGYRKICGKN